MSTASRRVRASSAGRRRGQAHRHHRRARRRASACGATRLDRDRRSAMRLLPVRPDHGGGEPDRQDAEAHRRRHRRRDDQYLSLRNLSAHPRRRSIAPPNSPRSEEATMNAPLDAAACSSPPACPPPAASPSRIAARAAAAASDRPEPWAGRAAPQPDEVNAFVVDRSRRYDPRPDRQVGDGPGRDDFAGDDRRRGTRMRLRQGQGRIRLRQPQPPRRQALSAR